MVRDPPRLALVLREVIWPVLVGSVFAVGIWAAVLWKNFRIDLFSRTGLVVTLGVCWGAWWVWRYKTRRTRWASRPSFFFTPRDGRDAADADAEGDE